MRLSVFRPARLVLATALATLATPVLAGAKVVVTIKPLHALVAAVMGEAGSPDLLVQGAASAHTYSLKPSDASKLNTADVLFRMSGTMEAFTTKFATTLPKSVQIVTLQGTRGLKLLPRRTGATFEQDDHGHDHKHRHRHSPDDDTLDGHAWLDPVNAKVIVDRIVQVLSAKDTANAGAFKSNGEALKGKLDDLTAELQRELAPVAKKPFILFHDALQYFERRFGLRAVGSISVNPDVPPSAQRLSTLRKKIQSLGAVCVMAEPQFDPRLVTNLAEGTRARTGTVDPEGAKIEPGPELYFTLLRNLARDLKSCLAAA
jgi:zinc transport system substrate-binding protein